MTNLTTIAHETRLAGATTKGLLSRWELDRSSGRPTLRLVWQMETAAQSAPEAAVA